MNGLTGLLAVAAVVAALAVVFYQRRRGSASDRPLAAGFIAVLIVASSALYAGFGRFGDWQEVHVDNDAAHLLTAKITEAQRKTKLMPDNAYAHEELAGAYMEAGRYREAVEAYDVCLKLGGEKADVLGKKAYALYYRDGRRLTDEVRGVIERTLTLNRFEEQVLMLLGQDAFMHERWEEAIGYWRTLLDSGAAPARERALLTAIANAEARARKQD